MDSSSISTGTPPAPSTWLKGLRVCFLAGTLGQGGAERQLYYILSCLKESGAYPTLLCLTEGEHWQQRIEGLGIPVVFVGSEKSRLKRVLNIIRVLRQLRPQVLQSQHFFTNIYCALAGSWLGIPTVAAVRSDGLSEIRGSNRIARIAGLRLPKHVAVNSLRAIENLTREGFSKERFFFFPNVIDTRRFYVPHEKKVVRERFTVLGVGRLVRTKRFDLFIEIVGRAAVETETPIHAIIVGDGPERAFLEGLAVRARNQGASVDFCGSVTNPLGLYLSADAFLLTSDWEGTPNVVMEAMACGLPVVASDVGGVGELIRHEETGCLFGPGDRDAAVAFLKNLFNSPGRAAEIGSNASRFIESERSLNLLPSTLAALYCRVFDNVAPMLR